MKEKRHWRDAFIEFAEQYSVKASHVNSLLEAEGSSPLSQGVKLIDLIARPQLNIAKLASALPAVAEFIESIPAERREEILEAAEILVKYRGYIARERLNAEKIRRLEDVKIPRDFDFGSIKALSTEARQKLAAHRPPTIGSASRIPGISPSDVNILLLMMNR